MAKPEKKNGKKEARKKDKDSVEAAAPIGRLIALEGTHGDLLRSEGERLARFCSEEEPAWSLWDASNTFYEMSMVKAKNLTPTPRALVLLYASDLLFRLRWEIEPTMHEGRTVVAAPYVQSVVAFGIAAGLPKEWLEELFSFAPKPAASYRLKEKKKGKNKDKDKKKNGNGVTGFVEFFCPTLARQFPGFDTTEIRSVMIKYLKGLQEDDQILELGKKPKQIKRARL